MRNMKLVVMAAFATTACIDSATGRTEVPGEGVNQGGSSERVEVAVGSATSQVQPGDQAGALESSPSTPSNAAITQGSPPLSLTMPVGVRGKWRRSTEVSVTAAQCVDSANTNMGLILTIRSEGFNRFEDGGRLLRVHERDSSQIRATFDTTYADTPTQGEFLFKAQDNGQALIEQQYGDGALPGILRYCRCPSS